MYHTLTTNQDQNINEIIRMLFGFNYIKLHRYILINYFAVNDLWFHSHDCASPINMAHVRNMPERKCFTYTVGKCFEYIKKMPEKWRSLLKEHC